jgi:hypothetical protein
MSSPSAGRRGAACGRTVELRRPGPSPAKIRVGGLEVTTTRMPGGAQFLHAAWLPRSQGARHDDDDDEVLLSVAGGPLSLLFLPRRPFPCSAARVGVVLSPASVAALSPTSDSVLSPTSGVCGGLRLDGWLGMARGCVGPPPRPRVQARPGRTGRHRIWRRRSRTQPSCCFWRRPVQPKKRQKRPPGRFAGPIQAPVQTRVPKPGAGPVSAVQKNRSVNR